MKLKRERDDLVLLCWFYNECVLWSEARKRRFFLFIIILFMCFFIEACYVQLLFQMHLLGLVLMDCGNFFCSIRDHITGFQCDCINVCFVGCTVVIGFVLF